MTKEGILYLIIYAVCAISLFRVFYRMFKDNKQEEETQKLIHEVIDEEIKNIEK